MNKIDFTQPGGFPLDQDVFGFQQSNIFMAAQGANLAGPLAILAGCLIAGSQAGNGYVIINGETLPFVGGVIQPKVVIVETTESMTYEDGSQKPSQISRYATFGDDGVTDLLWANFRRNSTEGILARLDRLEVLARPFMLGGGVVVFNKPHNEIPEGWREVVDFAGRFPMGRKPGIAGFDDSATGGNEAHTLTKAELPADLSAPIPMASSDNGTGRIDAGSGGTDTLNINLGGGGQSFSILNPYRIVEFIEPIPEYLEAV